MNRYLKKSLTVFIAPLYKFRKKYLSSDAIYKYCHKFSGFVFKRSTDMALIMILLNGLAIYLAHNAQIAGLEKSHRENKDFLIGQEKVEKKLDLVFTLIPPVLIDNFVQKKLESGQFITRLTENNLKYKIAPAGGVLIQELGDISYIKPFRKVLYGAVCNLGLYIKKLMKSKPEKLWKKLNIQKPFLNEAVPAANIFDIAIEAEAATENKIEGLYNKSAYDDTVGQFEGLRKIVSISSLIIISYLLMPIVKNKLAAYNYKKYLEKIGETPESLKRKNLYNSLKNIEFNKDNKNIFREFNTDNKDVSEPPPELLRYKHLKTQKTDKIFNEITFYKKSSSHSAGLRI